MHFWFIKNISEFDIANQLEIEFKRFGAKSLSFKSIVAKDKNSSLIANVEKNRSQKTLKRMAVPLKDLSMITSSEPVFIINNEKIKE